MTERVLTGPFFTRAQASRRAGVRARLLVHRPDLLSVASPWLQEAYFAFQFDDHGVRPDVGYVVQHLKGRSSDIDIGDWLVRPNRALDDATPLRVLDSHVPGAVDRVIEAADLAGPIAEDLWMEVLSTPGRGSAPASTMVSPPTRRSRASVTTA